MSGFIQTLDGGKFWPLNPKAEDVKLEDIAHSLAMQCRWNGYTSKFYSVAQHAVYVSRMVKSPGACLAALHHDSPEAYLCDIPRPIKSDLYKQQEKYLANCIQEAIKFQYSDEIEAEIKKADTDILFLERDELIGHIYDFENPPEKLHPGGDIRDVDPTFYPWSPEFAKAMFLREHEKLTEVGNAFN